MAWSSDNPAVAAAAPNTIPNGATARTIEAAWRWIARRRAAAPSGVSSAVTTGSLPDDRAIGTGSFGR